MIRTAYDFVAIGYYIISCSSSTAVACYFALIYYLHGTKMVEYKKMVLRHFRTKKNVYILRTFQDTD